MLLLFYFGQCTKTLAVAGYELESIHMTCMAILGASIWTQQNLILDISFKILWLFVCDVLPNNVVCVI